MSEYSTFLFDLDGTLIDTIPLIIESYGFATQQVLGEVYDDATYRSLIGLNLATACSTLSAEPAQADQILQAYLHHNMTHHDSRIRAFPGVMELLAELRSRGARLGVVTSKRRENALLGLELCQLGAFFGVVVAGDDVNVGKPDPECVLTALRRLSAPAAGAVMIGDSVHDVDAGRRAGAATMFVTWGAGDEASLGTIKPDWTCHTVAEIGTSPGRLMKAPQ